MTFQPRDPHQPPPHSGTARGGDSRPVRRPTGRTTVAVAVAAVLALGGAAAYATTTDGPSGQTPSPTISPFAPGQPGQSVPSGPSSGLSGPADPGDPSGPGIGPGGAVHGEVTVRDSRSGGWTVVVWQRGTVQSAPGNSVIVRSADGATWTWRTTADTAGPGGITQGTDVMLLGTRGTDGTATARRILGGFPRSGGRPFGHLRGPRWDMAGALGAFS
ncbi:hypothetical protein [Peterkaempfera griseoplana]|uniref:hypothetical protein n=1 Tax=Peterkaempfera griseoplana TaxID=66896 RepID=UPI0006E408FE|nr:hypothetical protein [Peterkaempfera griseoplana]